MIVPIIGISSSIPTNYNEIVKKLRQLGLSPTGDIIVDRSRLEQAIAKRVEKFELAKKEEAKTEEENIKNSLELEKPGATNQAQLNRFFHNI